MEATNRYYNDDINACREWLYMFGFAVSIKGWNRPDGAHAILQFWRGTYVATIIA